MEFIIGSEDALVEKVVQILRHKCYEKRKVIIGIPGGRSVEGIFNRMRQDEQIPWDKIHIFFIDERSDGSNYKIAYESFISKLTYDKVLPAINVHPFRNNIESYEDEFFNLTDRFDLVILGSGEDGHIASLFPMHPSMGNPHHGFIQVTESPKPPADRMSASKGLIMEAETAILLFIGSEKQEAFKKFKDHSLTEQDCPAKIVESIEDTYVLSDQY